jgi:hypothetical protein
MRCGKALWVFLCLTVLLTGRVSRSDPFSFRDDFEGYHNDGELHDVWDPDNKIGLGQEGDNQYLRGHITPPSTQARLNVWILPTGDLSRQDLAADIRCTAVNSGYAYFYILDGGVDYRSVARSPLSTGMPWTTLLISSIVPGDFVRFDGGSGTPDLTASDGLGVTFWVDTKRLGSEYVELDNFSVTPEPSVLLTLGLPCALLSRAILRKCKHPRR